MKFPTLRRYIKSKNLHETYFMHDRELIIDARSFFKNSYKDSGCQYVLGTDCDRYADHIIGKLTCFINCNIKCHVIFKGTSKDDLEKRKAKHQTVIENRTNVAFDLSNSEYFDPLFVNDVQKQVLEEMGIKYFCCEYDSMEAIVGIARRLKCPVLTDNIEYCLFKVSCIPPNSVIYRKGNKELECTMYEHNKHQVLFGVFNKTPILLTVLSHNKDFLNAIPELSGITECDDITPVIRWVKRQPKDFDVAKYFEDESATKAFQDIYNRIKILFLYPSNHLAVSYFRRVKPYGLFKDDKKWFAKGVSDGRIGLPYVNIKKKGLLIGSTIINDVHKSDAILAAVKIIAYNHSLLTNSRQTALNFVGRKGADISIWAIETDWSTEISNRRLFRKTKFLIDDEEVYSQFFKGIRPGHDILNILSTHTLVSKDCWILLITVVYFVDNVNEDFIDVAYFIFLSYLLLGPVSTAIHEFEENEESVKDNVRYKDAQKIYDQFRFLFRKVDLAHDYNVSIIHRLAEFQHCLQHMNYLNNICGKQRNYVSIPSTIYHDTYNATFIYNAFLLMRNKDNLMRYLEDYFDESNIFVKLFIDIVSGFEICRNPSPEMLISASEYCFSKLIKIC